MAKATGYRVIGAVAVIRKNGHERYISRDGIFSAEQIDEDNAKHLLGVGLIEKFDPAPAGDAGGAVAEAPSDKWNHEKIDAWAASQTPPISFADLGENPTKAQKLEAIAAASQGAN